MTEHKYFRKFSRRAAEICFATMVVFVSGCSGGLPSESDAQDVFQSKHQKNIDQGLVRIDSFSKVNAQRGEMFGVKLYEVEYHATISWPKGLNTRCLGDGPKGIDCMMGAKTREVGQAENLKGTLKFEETEKGWKGENGKIY